MATVEVDTAYLSATYSFPQQSFDSLLEDPTPALTSSLFEQLIATAKQYEVVQSEKLKLDVQLEAAVHGGESRLRSLKESNDRNAKEIESLRRQLNDSGMLIYHGVCIT